MKNIIVYCFVMLGFSVAVANTDFEAQKAKRLEAIEAAIKSMNANKACVAGAKDQEAMKVCQQKMASQRIAKRAQTIDKKIERLEKRKKKLEEKSDK